MAALERPQHPVAGRGDGVRRQRARARRARPTSASPPGAGRGHLFVKGQVVRVVPEAEMVDALVATAEQIMADGIDAVIARADAGRGSRGRGDARRAARHPGRRRQPRRREDRQDPGARRRVSCGGARPPGEAAGRCERTADAASQPRLRCQSRRRAARPVSAASVSRSARSASTTRCRRAGASRLGAHHPREQVIGERGVAGEDRTVEVGAEDALGEHAVDAVHAVAVAHASPGRGARRRVRASCDRRGSRSR